MVPDRQKVRTDRRTDGQNGRTDAAKTISLRLRRGIIKADDAGSNMVPNSLPTDTPSTQEVGVKMSTISFSESSHVAYQI